MHPSSFAHMQSTVQQYLGDCSPLSVLDIGSYDVNGSYKPIFNRPGWTYVGVDQTEGPNVDVISKDPHKLPFNDNHFGLVVSGQAFEHMEYFWIAILEIARVLKPNGKAIIIAPSKGPEHRYPIDCWRFYPDGFQTLGKWSGLAVLTTKSDLADVNSGWGDTVGVFQKPSDWNLANTALATWTGVREVHARSEAILNSTSWKITAPMRAVAQALRRRQRRKFCGFLGSLPGTAGGL
jgi:SAM-dependent methyltransferase